MYIMLIKESRYDVNELIEFAGTLLCRVGMDLDKAQTVAEILVEGDLMGHDTHGLGLLPSYLGEIEKDSMLKSGEPQVLSDYPAALTWDGMRLPGPWLVVKAMYVAMQRASIQGSCTVVIRRSHHIACLAAYLKRATDKGMLMQLHCSDRNSASVAPFGGLDPVFTPNPMSFGIPTQDIPLLIDVSTSATTNGLTKRSHVEGKLLPAAWLMDGFGNPSNDPAVLFNEPKGTILPLGGKDSGHKGYGLTLVVEALTGGLAGQGRADPKEGWGATVFLQIIDPRAFAGLDAFTRQTSTVATMCRSSRPATAGQTVRTPGERGLALARVQKEQGLALYPSVLPGLASWAEKLKLALPQALA